MTPRDLQTLRNMGNEAEEAADEIDRLRAELERLRAQEPVAWAYVNTDGECEEIAFDSGPCPEKCISLYSAAPPAQPAQRLTDEQITLALQRAYSLGQTYWQQADSDYTSEHRKSDATHAKFKALIAETIATAPKD